MLIVLNIDPRLLAELLVTASQARRKAATGRGRREPPAEDAARPGRKPGRPRGGGRAAHVRAAR